MATEWVVPRRVIEKEVDELWKILRYHHGNRKDREKAADYLEAFLHMIERAIRTRQCTAGRE